MNVLPNASLPWPIPYEAVMMCAESEGCRLKAYICPAGIPTIGWGHTGPDVIIGRTVWTQAEADRQFCEDLTEFATDVLLVCRKNPPNDNQLGALVSFAYNCGGWRKSTVIKQHNAGNYAAAARAFALWNKARVNGKLTQLRGLTSRRAAEAALYLKPDEDERKQAMPQAVESESRLAASPIAQGGVVTAGAGVLTLVSDASDQLGTVGTVVQHTKSVVVDALGVPADYFLPTVLVLAGAGVIFWRWKQRKGGWA